MTVENGGDISPSNADVPEPYSIFDKRQKALIVFIASTASTFSGFASNIYFPALATVASDLNVSIELINLTITSYLILQGIAPSLWGPVSDVKGRRVAYCFTFLVFIGACIGLAETRNYATLIVLRSLQSSGSASTIAVGAAVIGDITTREERGGYMGIFQAGQLAPVAIGPVIGGALAASLGWRAIFWFLTIYGGVFLVFLFFALPETLRSVVGNGGTKTSKPFARYPLNFYQKTTKVKFTLREQSAQTAKKKTAGIDVTGPIRILFSKQAAPLVVFVGLYYAVWQMSITAMATLFQARYGLGETQIGLTFIANGAGSIIGTLITGKILDIEYRNVKAAHEAALSRPGVETEGEQTSSQPRSQPQSENKIDNNSNNNNSTTTFPLERARLRILPLLALCQCASILTFGWTIQYTVPIAVPIITTFFTGWTVVSITSVSTTYLIDVFGERKAAASASVNLSRCLLAAASTSLVTPVVAALGIGWTFTVAAAVQLVALSGVAVQWRFGRKWRLEAEAKTIY